MPNFATWLHDKSAADDPNLRDLKNFADTSRDWPYWSDRRADFQSHIDASSLPNKAEVAATLAEYYGEWRAEERAARKPQGFWQGFKDHSTAIGLVLFGILIASAMIMGLYKPEFYSTLANTEQTRGLITFLFVVATSGIILLIAIAIFWMDLGENIKERFSYAKDLLTIVIGILGTILGFYFGAQTSESGIAVTQLALSQPIATSNTKVTLTGRIAGGKGPYTASLEFTDPLGAIRDVAKLRKELKSDTGVISHEIEVPEIVRSGAIMFVVTAKDSKSVQAQGNGILLVQQTQKPQPQPKSEPPQTPDPLPPKAAAPQ